MKRSTAFILSCVLVPVVCLASDWQFLLKWGSLGSGDGQFNTPTGLAVSYSGVVYVADSGNHRIQTFDGETGAFLDKWGTFGTGDGQFNRPTSVACGQWSSGVYVADTGNNRIQRFASDGSCVTQWGSYGSGPGQFDGPRGIACDWGGNVYVADSGNHRIQKFSADGDFLLQWGSQGAGFGMLDSPCGLAYLESYLSNYEAIAVADEMNNRVQIFQLDGTPIMGLDHIGLLLPKGVCAVEEWGGCFIWTSICIADTGHDRIKPDEGASWGTYGLADGQFRSPSDVASRYLSLGRLVWVADTGNHRIQLFDFPMAVSPSTWSLIKALYR